MFCKKSLIALLTAGVLLVSCKEDDPIEDSITVSAGDYLISGQGSGAGSGSVSYLSSNLLKTVNSLLEINNGGLSTGTYLQSLAFSGDKTYIVTDNANTITVVNSTTFKKLGTITTGLEGPKFMAIDGNVGYVTNYGNGNSFVAVVNLSTNTVTDKIDVTAGPERIIVHNGKLYMTHTWSDDVVTVIDINTKVVTEIDVEDNPDELFIGADGKLVVLSEGGKLYNSSWTIVVGNTKGAIQKINLTTNTVDSQVDFTVGDHPNLLVAYNNDYYYHLDGKVYQMSSTSTSLPTSSIISRSLTGMLVHNNKLIGVDAGLYKALSDLYVYDLGSKSLLMSSKVGIGATQIYAR